MPNVKAPQVPTNLPGAMPGPNVRYDVRGTSWGNIAEGVSEGAKPVLKQRDKAKEKADEDVFVNLKLQASEWRRKNVTALPEENENAALNRKGISAINLAPETAKAYKKYLDELATSLPSKEVSDAFTKWRLGDEDELYGQVNRHERKEYEETSQKTFNASIGGYVSDAAKSYDVKTKTFDPAPMYRSLANGLEEISKRADIEKVSKAEHDRMVRVYSTQVYMAALEPLSRDNPMEASKIYEAAKKRGEIDPNVPGVDRFENTLHVHGIRRQGIDEANSTLEKYGNGHVQALKDIETRVRNKTLNPEVAEVARVEIDQRKASYLHARDKVWDDAYNGALDRMVTVPGWTPTSDPAFEGLKGSGKQKALIDAWEAEKKRTRGTVSEVAAQKRVDKEAIENYKANLILSDDKALDEKSLSDSEYLASLTEDGAQISSTAIAEMRRHRAEATVKLAKKESVGREKFRKRLNSWLASNERSRGMTPRTRAIVAASVLTQYDTLEASKKGTSPTAEEATKLFSQGLQWGYADPDAIFIHEPMYRAEAEALGKGRKFKPIETEDTRVPVPAGHVRVINSKTKEILDYPIRTWERYRGDPTYADWEQVDAEATQ